MPGKIFLSFCILLCYELKAQLITVKSPDESITITIHINDSVTYAVSRNGENIVYRSSLGFEFKNTKPLGSGLRILNNTTRTVNEKWSPVVKSKHAEITDHFNELALELIEAAPPKRRVDIFFRAYNDGIAFRYQLYNNEQIGDTKITKEKTTFRLPRKAIAWLEKLGSYTTSQECEFIPVPMDSIKPKTIGGLPLLIELDKKNYAAITEANIDNYPGFYVTGVSSAIDKDIVTLGIKLSPLPGEDESGVKASFSGRQFTPWRVVMLGSTPGSLICSEIIQNLNEPLAIKDPSWIKPGLSAWDNWWSGEVKMDMPTIKKYIDLAAKMGWPYMLIDWQWYGTFNNPDADITKAAPQLDMPEILQYARSKNVKCWLWIYSTDVNRNSNYEKAFPLYEQWGVAGIKIDFMDRDDQEMVNWYHKIIKAAADHHLMVDFHGAYKPDGIIRTYPNMITREGVLGEEYSKFSKRITPRHNVTLPFTRMLAGQMDYTPGGFLNVTSKDFKNQTPTLIMNTRCAELSKFVIYESPFMVNCEHPDHIIDQPGTDFLKVVPTVWDDIRVLDGYPGEFITLAKRNGATWFMASMTNENARENIVSLDFLPEGKYEIEVWEDAKDANRYPQHLKKRKSMVDNHSKIKIQMAGSGGYVAIIKPI